MKNLSENKLESKDNNIHSNKEQKQPVFLESNDSGHNLTIQPSITLAKEGKPDLQITSKQMWKTLKRHQSCPNFPQHLP